MQGLLIHLDYCLTPTTRINNAAVVVHEGRILAMGGFSAFTDLENYEVLEMPGCYAAPGFVDTHIYGAAGYDCMHADTNPDITAMSRMLAEHGVTAFLPTTQSAPRDKLRAVVAALADICRRGDTLPGAVPVGVHVEGPFLSKGRHGAHAVEHIRRFDMDEANQIIAAGGEALSIFTFAPEQPGIARLAAALREADVVPSMGHTLADQNAVTECIEAGANRCSHLYNGMAPLEQRHVGLAAIAMTDDRIWVELIPDGVHIHPGMIDLACRAKDKSKLVCISNSTEAAGLGDGDYVLGDQEITVQDGKAYLKGADTLAGSVSFLDQNFRQFLSFSHLSLPQALACFTLNPARSIGLKDRGEIKPGRRADLIVLNAQHEVMITLVKGKVVHCRGGIDIPEFE